jgi:hypothetical protein
MGREPADAPNRSITARTHSTTSGLALTFFVPQVGRVHGLSLSEVHVPTGITYPTPQHAIRQASKQLGRLRLCPFKMVVLVIVDDFPPWSLSALHNGRKQHRL